MDKIKVNLIALTGFGNEALKALLREKGKVEVIALYTRPEKGKFPYYKEENIAGLSRKRGIRVVFVPLKGNWSIKDKADINLVATFHRILKAKHLKKARYSINIHPSLLPSYKGPTPTNWIISNGEKMCGLSAHMITNKVDEGPVILQNAYAMKAKNDSELRRFLAKRTGAIAREIISKFPNYSEVKSMHKESYYPFFSKAKGGQAERMRHEK